MKTSRLAIGFQFNELLLGRFVFCLAMVLTISGVASPAQESTRSSGWVVIPVDEYRVLRAKAYPADHDPEPPPLEATLTRVDYELKVGGDLASGRASLTVDVLKDGWVRIPVPPGLLVREARLDGKLLSLVPNGQNKTGPQFSALLSHPGRAVLLLEVDVPVAASAGEESISLPSTGSGVTRASVEVPRLGVDLRVGGGLLSEKSEASETKWTAYGRGNEHLTFTWRKKTEDHHSDQPLRLRGSLIQLLSLGEDSTSIYAEVNLEIVQGAARDVKIQLPEKVTINQVSGAMVADWAMKGGELAVTFLEPVEQTARFVINGETRLPRDGLTDIPLLRLLNTERDTGGVAVEVLGAGEIKSQKAQGLEDADATDLGDMVASRQSPSLAAFKFRSGDAKTPRSLSVNVARYDQQAVLMANIEEARYQVLMSNDGKTLVQARYAVRNNQRNFVKIALPTGATVWAASLAGKPVRPGQSPDGSLLLPLEKARGGEEAPAFVVEITYINKGANWDDKGRTRVSLPALDLPISRTGLLLYYPPRYRVSTEPGSFRTQEYENPTSAALSPPVSTSVFAGTGIGVGSGSGAGIGAGTGAAIGGPVVASAAPAAPGTNAFHGDAADYDVKEDKQREATRALLDTFRTKSLSGRVTGILPINVQFPAFGPSIFLVSELTGENQSPAAELTFQREKKGGTR